MAKGTSARLCPYLFLNPSGTVPVEVRTEYEYDEANRLIWIEDANDHKTKYEYDKNGRRIATSLPLGKKSYTTYDEVGNVYTTTDFNGDSISYQYDEQNRLIKKEFSAASGQVPVTFTYTPSGQIDKIVDARGTTTFKYDERNRLISRTDPNGVYLASGHTIEYGYDAAGNRTEVRTPNGNVSYTYDEQNRLKTVTSSQGTTTYFYDVAGNLVKTELPNGVVETRDYDELNRLKLVKNSKDGVVISSFDYTLDLVGHRRVVQEQNGRKVEYEYDSLYQLTKETITDAVAGNRIVEYTYDKVGNRLTKNDSVEGITTYTYDDNDRLKTEELKKNNVVVQTIEYRYDDNGNLLSRIKNGVEEVSYTWDKENRLIGVRKANGEVISYQYDSDGVRVSSTVNGVKTEYLVDKNLPFAQVLEERVNNGLTAGYVYGNDLISQQRGSEKSFYFVDGLGSTRGLTDASGVVTDRYSYDAFGNLIGSGGNTENNYLFAGEQFDKSLGDYYLRARYYDTDTGRFTRRDSYAGSISEPLTLHKYIYTNDNPVNGVDPSGLSNISETLSTLNLFNQLAVRAYTVLSRVSPVAIDLAKAWAVIIGGAGVALLVLEETNRDSETSVRVVPDEAYDDKRDDLNQMRLQLQDAPGNTFGIPIVNVPEMGVTVGQVGQAVLTLWALRRNLASWFPKEHDTALIKAMAGVTKKAKEGPPIGVFQGSSQVYSRQWNRNDPRGNKSVSRGYYRVDFENLRGHNLKNF